jgi:membrane-associated phospholipid phosphatase
MANPADSAHAPDLWARFGDAGRFGLDSAAVVLPLQRRNFDGSFDAVSSLFLTTAVCKGLKAFVPERRPDGENMNSFPSQHAAECIAAGLALRRHFGRSTGTAALALATAVALSRLFAKKHHTIDVIAGIVIGAASSLAVDGYERNAR